MSLLWRDACVMLVAAAAVIAMPTLAGAASWSPADSVLTSKSGGWNHTGITSLQDGTTVALLDGNDGPGRYGSRITAIAKAPGANRWMKPRILDQQTRNRCVESRDIDDSTWIFSAGTRAIAVWARYRDVACESNRNQLMWSHYSLAQGWSRPKAIPGTRNGYILGLHPASSKRSLIVWRRDDTFYMAKVGAHRITKPRRIARVPNLGRAIVMADLLVSPNSRRLGIYWALADFSGPSGRAPRRTVAFKPISKTGKPGRVLRWRLRNPWPSMREASLGTPMPEGVALDNRGRLIAAYVDDTGPRSRPRRAVDRVLVGSPAGGKKVFALHKYRSPSSYINPERPMTVSTNSQTVVFNLPGCNWVARALPLRGSRFGRTSKPPNKWGKCSPPGLIPNPFHPVVKRDGSLYLLSNSQRALHAAAAPANSLRWRSVAQGNRLPAGDNYSLTTPEATENSKGEITVLLENNPARPYLPIELVAATLQVGNTEER